jgi:rubrerythrin
MNMCLFQEMNMMSSKDELIAFIHNQIEIEKQIVNSLKDSLLPINNEAVKGVLQGIALDSEKHAQMYSAALKLLTDVSSALTQEHLDKQIELVEKHIQIEAEIIKRLDTSIVKFQNEKVRLLLDTIMLDEKRHHNLLKEVLQILVRGETITEEDWWDFLWKDVPTHGSPGG